MVIETKDLCKYYGDGNNRVKALDQVSVEVEKGEFIGVVGKSGSGKSTLLNMIGGLDHPTRGTIRIGDEDISEMNDEQLTKMRRSKIGFIFQNYNLMPVLNVYENIVLPLKLDGLSEDSVYLREIIQVLKDHNWDGYLLSEYEGADKYDPGYEVGQTLRKQHIMLKNYIGE